MNTTEVTAMNKKKLLKYTAAAAALTAYSAVTGKGIFNKIRFKNEHDAIARYVEGNYPGASYSPVQKTEMGCAVVVRRPNKTKLMLYVTKSPDGHYIFREVK